MVQGHGIGNVVGFQTSRATFSSFMYGFLSQDVFPFFKRGLMTSVSGRCSRAYERTSLIVTTDLPFEQWAEIIGSERLTGALMDRLTHRVHILEANGESYRLREARNRIKPRSPRRTKDA
jgi:hypothetical protein